jgi:hypothetical protein
MSGARFVEPIGDVKKPASKTKPLTDAHADFRDRRDDPAFVQKIHDRARFS